MDLALRADNLTKEYRLYRRPADRLLELFLSGSRHQTFGALRDVSFEIPKGETVGLVGQNGAGKSTLLKLLCNVTTPSAGTLETHGSIASILELGMGFHPEFTGRDNAALNAAILGLNAAQVRERLPEILEFSELGTFLDQPVKTYSSGMYMRLAFSVAVNVRPDILIIDEALAVGDGHFQKKCIDRIRDFQRDGRTILFCSHSLYYVTTLCSRVLWLDKGQVRAMGPSIEVVHDYESFLMEQDRLHAADESVVPAEIDSPARIAGLLVLDDTGAARTEFDRNEPARIQLTIESRDPSIVMRLSVVVDRAADETQCFVFDTTDEGETPLRVAGSRIVELRLDRLSLSRGEYGIVATLYDRRGSVIYDRINIRPAITIVGGRYEIGLFSIEHEWELVDERPASSR